MTALPLFAELCAGTAALSLRLHGGKNARPPVSRMGNKQGYASAILRCLGLRSGSGAARYLLCEPDDGCRLLLTSYTDADLRNKAAEIIRGWKDEEPRALWDRLRAEGPVKAPPVDPRELARWCWVQKRTLRSSCFKKPLVGGLRHTGGDFNYQPVDPAPAIEILTTLPASILPDARAVDPPQLPPGSVVIIDPPYLGHLGEHPTTGYAHSLPRADVLTMARRWADAGAWVVICECAPIVELEGWHVVDITGERIGQKRTFSKQQREYLTMNRPPAWRPAVQSTLF